MAVPKKRTSKSKKNLRKTVWKKKIVKQAVNAAFIASWFSGELKDKKNFKGFRQEELASPVDPESEK